MTEHGHTATHRDPMGGGGYQEYCACGAWRIRDTVMGETLYGRWRDDPGERVHMSHGVPTSPRAMEGAPSPADLRAWRETEGLTQERAGKLAGVERLAWARWESGTRPVPQWLRDTLLQRWGSAPTAACTHPRREPASGLPPGAWTCPDCGAVGMPSAP